MELSMSGNALKTFNRCVTCLSRVGTELVFQASPSQLELHTLNSSRSAYQSISLTPSFFDTYSVSSSNPNPNGSDSSPDPLQCSVLLKAVQSVLRTPAVTIDQLSLTLPSPDASKLMFSLHCTHGVKKTYWITCNAEPEIQHLSLDKTKFPSSLVVRPRDLARLLSNFQASLHEISIIATEVSSGPSDPPPGDLGGKAVELRSYIDPAKEDSDARLHTQLWIDPVEEFLQYTHVGDPVDVTFGVKELKAFLAFCEGCEVDIHLFFEKAGEPILMAPRFGLDDGSSADFDASLVLATMLVSQLTEGNNNNINNNDNNINNNNDNMDQVPVQNSETVPENTTTEHTKIWSELSGSGIRNSQMNRENPISSVQNGIQGLNVVNAPQEPNNLHQTGVETDHVDEPQVMEEENNYSQHHPSNWIGDEDNDDDDDEDEELYVQSTPQYYD